MKMSDDLLKQLRKGDAMDGKTVSCKHDLCNCAIMDEAADHIEKLEARLKKAIDIVDDYAYTAGKWIDSEIDYEEFYSWREELDQ
jgi:hypothetical protein